APGACGLGSSPGAGGPYSGPGCDGLHGLLAGGRPADAGAGHSGIARGNRYARGRAVRARVARVEAALDRLVESARALPERSLRPERPALAAAEHAGDSTAGWGTVGQRLPGPACRGTME